VSAAEDKRAASFWQLPRLPTHATKISAAQQTVARAAMRPTALSSDVAVESGRG
jgi:hypothetical protein